MKRLCPVFRNCPGKPRVDDRRLWGGMILINRKGLRWRDAPRGNGPAKTLRNRVDAVGSSRRSATGSGAPAGMGVFARKVQGLARDGTDQKTRMIDARYLKAHRMASCPRTKSRDPAIRAGVGLAERRAGGTPRRMKSPTPGDGPRRPS